MRRGLFISGYRSPVAKINYELKDYKYVYFTNHPISALARNDNGQLVCSKDCIGIL